MKDFWGILNVVSTNDVDSFIGIYISHGPGSLAGIGDIGDIKGWSAIRFQDCQHQKYTQYVLCSQYF